MILEPEPPRSGRGAYLQAEDLALFAVLAVAEPVLGDWMGSLLGLGGGAAAAGSPTAPLRAALLFATGAGAGACLVTRPRSEAAEGAAELMGGFAGWARFPLMVLIAATLAAGLEALGVATGEGFFFAVILLLTVPLAFHARLPELPVSVRRLLMTPIVLVGAGAFETFADGILAGGEPFRNLPARDDPIFGYAVLLLSLLTAGTAAFYVLLVAAPRAVAGSGGSTVRWALRFLLFLTGLVIGVSVPA